MWRPHYTSVDAGVAWTATFVLVGSAFSMTMFRVVAVVYAAIAAVLLARLLARRRRIARAEPSEFWPDRIKDR